MIEVLLLWNINDWNQLLSLQFFEFEVDPYKYMEWVVRITSYYSFNDVNSDRI